MVWQRFRALRSITRAREEERQRENSRVGGEPGNQADPQPLTHFMHSLRVRPWNSPKFSRPLLEVLLRNFPKLKLRRRLRWTESFFIRELVRIKSYNTVVRNGNEINVFEVMCFLSSLIEHCQKKFFHWVLSTFDIEKWESFFSLQEIRKFRAGGEKVSQIKSYLRRYSEIFTKYSHRITTFSSRDTSRWCNSTSDLSIIHFFIISARNFSIKLRLSRMLINFSRRTN